MSGLRATIADAPSLDAAPLVVVLDASGRVCTFNRALEDLTEWSSEHARGQDWFATFLPEHDRARARVALDEAKAHSSCAIDAPLLTRNGAQLTARWHYSVICDEAGRIASFVAVGVETDSSRRARTDRELEALLAASPVGVFRLDRAGRCLFVNATWCIITGTSPRDALERGWTASLHPDDRDIVEVAWRRAAEERDAFRLEFRFVRGDGVVTWVLGQGIALRDDSDSVTGYIGTITDVTPMRRAEHEARAALARLSEAQRLAKIGSWELDLAKNDLAWSDEIFTIFEIDRRRFGASYQSFLDAVHPDDRAAVDTAYTTSLRDKRPYEITHRLLMSDGRIKWVSERCETFYDVGGVALRSVGTVQDVTTHVLTEQQLSQQLREKEVLLREIHHRVKNNLQIISSLLHFESKKTRERAAPETFSELRERLLAMTLVHEKLYQSKTLSLVDFGDYVRSLVRGLTASFGRRHAIRVEVYADAVELPVERALPAGMIICELVTNVLKYAYPETRDGTARVTIRTTSSRVTISVEDQGVGFPASFDTESGSSFGWELVRSLVAQLDGTVDVENARGAHVHVTFPTTSDSDAPAAHTSLEARWS